MGLLRVLLAMLLVVWTIGTPGLGIESRAGGAAIGWLYTFAYLAVILALATTWRATRFAPVLVTAAGAVAAIIAALDLWGVLSGPPPVAMIALDATAIAIGLFLIVRARRMRPAVA